ncbi:hypothetical protein EDB85DRAFT_2064191 [Lactarius pseudohatsudake]|nr:hypothetical protein EDB85DRAFT_2064191 [Lactarius pseudohatsudake]
MEQSYFWFAAVLRVFVVPPLSHAVGRPSKTPHAGQSSSYNHHGDVSSLGWAPDQMVNSHLRGIMTCPSPGSP